jgi:hypothetical protein
MIMASAVITGTIKLKDAPVKKAEGTEGANDEKKGRSFLERLKAQGRG